MPGNTESVLVILTKSNVHVETYVINHVETYVINLCGN